jgi:hypothetical protein
LPTQSRDQATLSRLRHALAGAFGGRCASIAWCRCATARRSRRSCSRSRATDEPHEYPSVRGIDGVREISEVGELEYARTSQAPLRRAHLEAHPEQTRAPRRRMSASLAVLLAALALVSVSRPARAADAPAHAAAEPAWPCSGLPVLVRGGAVFEREATCRGAADAIAFFEANGLPAVERIEVEIGAPLPLAVGERAAGCYDRSSKRVMLVDYERLRTYRTWFGQPVVPATYHALATHEIAHAIAGCHFAIPDPSHVAHEFVAYAASLERMDPELRDRILAAYPDEGMGDARLSDVLHGLEPTRFAVDAWLLWRQPQGGATLLQRVLRGEALVGGGGL